MGSGSTLNNVAEHQHDQSWHGDSPLPEIIELEAEALRDLTDTLTQWVAELLETPPRHLLDLGSGTGAGTFALMRRFPNARLTAVDSSPQMLQRLERRGDQLGQSARLDVVQADLDDELPAIDKVDLMWASSLLHHLSYPDRLFARAAALLPPGGWFVAVEAEDVAWFLPEDLGMGRPGLEGRCHELLSEYRAEHAPEIGSDWSARLGSAGLVVQAARVFDIEVPRPLPEPARRYARGLFGQLRGAATDRLDAEDIATLDVLLDEADPRSLARREDLTLRATQRTWAAQRPHHRQDAP